MRIASNTAWTRCRERIEPGSVRSSVVIVLDPAHPAYVDEKSVRDECSRVFDVCSGCRRCHDYCGSFSTLFEMLDRFDTQDAGRLAPAQQDRVVAECFQCDRCAIECPFGPDLHEAAVDVPRLMRRAEAMRLGTGQTTVRRRLPTRILADTDRVARLVSAAPLGRWFANAPVGSVRRRAVAAATGVSSVRLLPPFAKQRFSTWFSTHQSRLGARRQGRVTVFPTCLIEYHEPGIGRDLVLVYERNGIECSTTDAGCCGAPWLHAGDVRRFATVAQRNVERLANAVRRGTDIVVPQPTCARVLTSDYLDHVGGADAELVASHTFDAAGYLLQIHSASDTQLDTDFSGDPIGRVAHHVPCHARSAGSERAGPDLMRLTGAQVDVIEGCSGLGGGWGYRAEHAAASLEVAVELGERLALTGAQVMTGDCYMANTAIAEQTGHAPLHPISVLARAYGDR